MAATDSQRARWLLVLDGVMLVLISANLALLAVDWLYTMPSVQRLLSAYAPNVYAFYGTYVHEHFILYDLGFVSIFIVEITVRWIVAIRRGTYERWWYYPFAHWYDVLGCIPVGSLRSLRLLRIIAMVPKLQRLGWIDVRQLAVYQTALRYWAALIEEITDRVAARILESVKDGIREGHPVTEQIVNEAIVPQRDVLTEIVTQRLQQATAQAYMEYQEDFRTYLDGVIAKAVSENREIGTIASIPGVGGTISTLLEHAISDIVYRVIDQMVADVASPENDVVLGHIATISTDAVLMSDYDKRLSRLSRSMLIQSLDLIQEHVEIKQWKEQDPLPS
ncbi:hypothetical protein [Salisaeta longa]|uniref:hypothetical protein n=1 Tax=Salisaeta longa TaxID=503170 RepID=UPI0003B40EF5|nr:hypothetical protein [Salisaeta longa]